MADITSSTYPVVTDSKEGDQYAIVRQGQLKKQTRSALDEHIADVAATDFKGLSDTPGTYVGEASRVVTVKSDESGLEFSESAAPSAYLGLTDTPSSYAVQAGKRPAVNSGENAIEFTETTFIESSDTPSAYTGLAGSLLRINAGETGLEFFPNTGEIPNVVLVNEEADLPAVNGSGEHELAAATAYWFTTSLTLANPIRYMTTTTEVYGNGIGETIVTYTGAGYAIRATNGLGSVRLRYIQIISSTGDGIDFIGGGLGAGTNLSLDRVYIITPNGQSITAESSDFFFASAAVIIGQDPVILRGTDSGRFAVSSSLIQSTTLGNVLDFNGSKFLDIVASALVFEGPAGAVSIAGSAGSANITNSATFSGCISSPGLIALSGISSGDLGYQFAGNPGIPDSQTSAFGYISTTATTNVIDGTPVVIAGTWTESPVTERANVSAGGVVGFENLEAQRGQAIVSIGITKPGNGTDDYILRLEKSTDGGSIWNAVAGMRREVALEQNDPNSITFVGLVEYVSGDQFRVTIEGDGTGDDVEALSGQIVIGS